MHRRWKNNRTFSLFGLGRLFVLLFLLATLLVLLRDESNKKKRKKSRRPCARHSALRRGEEVNSNQNWRHLLPLPFVRVQRARRRQVSKLSARFNAVFMFRLHLYACSHSYSSAFFFAPTRRRLRRLGTINNRA